MRENGFLEPDWSEGTVEDLLTRTKDGPLYTAEVGESVESVINAMKDHGISQLPVVDDDEIVGLINETDVLEHLLEDGKRSDPINDLVETQFTLVETDNQVSMIASFFRQDKVVIVVDDDERPIGILTKIDFIDYVSDRM
jgi:cystathionine beta-synthase